MMRRRFIALAGALCALVGAFPASAGAQAGSILVRIREAALDENGSTRLVVSVTGAAVNQVLSASNFRVTEAGQPVENLAVQPLFQSRAVPVVVALLMDVSGSTAGKPIADAKAAAKSFINQLPSGVRVTIVGFGPTAAVRIDFTSDKNALARTIDGLAAAGDTALYDAIVLGGNRLNRVQAQHNMVLFSDGKDTVSKATLAQATSAATKAAAAVTVVGLVTPDYDAASLDAIVKATKGRAIPVGQSAQLAGAFQQVAKDIASQYVITYTSATLAPKDLPLAVTATVGAATASDQAVVFNPRQPPSASNGVPPPRPAGNKPLIGAFASKTGLYVGILGVFLAAVLFLGILLYQPAASPGIRALQRGLKLYTRGDKRKRREAERGGIIGTAIGRRATELVERVPRSAAFLERTQLKLDRAGWPLRATELVVFTVLGLVAGVILGFGLFQRWWLGLVLMAFGAAAPWLVLSQRIEKRSSAFLSQLPDTLQLLAGSLQAGYGFLQGLDTLVKESAPPTSTEFSRVLTESRLGLPVEDALSGMADRMGSEDFRWVVLAINIQRQVGGNLAQLLTTVANTLREREAVRRQIKVLSAEGRLSAVILIILPFGIAGYIGLVNPAFLKILFSETLGKVLIAGALVLMGIGAVWMRKIIKIDV